MNKKNRDRQQVVALFGVGLSAVGSLFATSVTSTATANSIQQSEPSGDLQLAQGLVGQCRAAKQRIFVYTQRSTTSPTITTIGANERVTLADSGSGGLIAISAPTTGYVQAQYLASCGTAPAPAPKPQPTASLCRAVTYKGPEGLAIRRGPNKTSARVAGLKLGDRVTLKTSARPSNIDSEGRAWVEITAPTAGWISYGYLNSGSSNIGACP